jgi:hypothetical protein
MAAQDGAETQNTSETAMKTRKLIPTFLVINYFKVLCGRTS